MLTADEIDRFSVQGFLAVSDLGIAAEIDELRTIYDELFDRRVAGSDDDRLELVPVAAAGGESLLPQIMKPARHAPELYDTLLYANVTAMGRQLLGEDATVDFEHAIRKPPGVGPETPWHQDAAYWDPGLVHDTVSVWVPLQPVDTDNGCMQFVPGSQHLDVLTHKHIGDDPQAIGLVLDEQHMHLVAEAVACPLPSGGATFHGGYTVHYTGPNRTSDFRRALILDVRGARSRSRSKPLEFTW